MTHDEYNNQLISLVLEKGRIQQEISLLKEKYKTELLERNGYKIGDQLDCNGTPCVISGIDEFGGFYLQLKKLKKDGTPSQNGISGGYLKYRLKED
jgi:hypothetical protein